MIAYHAGMLSRQDQAMILRILPTLNEAQARWFVAKDAIALGRGGLKYLHELTGMSRPTIMRGMKELKSRGKLDPSGRIRAPGGGRKRIEERDPEIDRALERIMEETTAGDPMSALHWTCKSTTRIAEQLTREGHPISQRTAHRKLCELGYSLQLNVKHKEGTAPKNRDQQFREINSTVNAFMHRGEPVLSVDTKKKELVGEFKNSGKSWRPKGDPRKVNVYDYPSLSEGKAIPYGAYDVGRNEGFVNVGMTHDTAEFAVNSIRQWWNRMGRIHYSGARRLLICADGGGSNGSRNRAWKYYLQQFVDELALDVSVCHYPPGTSKWNKIEHRLFSFISLHWQGEPLVSYETVVTLIGTTTTRKGLKVKAKLDKKKYKKGVKITDEEMEKLNIEYDAVNPQWNYTIKPRKKTNNRRKRIKK
jgi:hypothetical protein